MTVALISHTSNTQNSASEVSTVWELWTSRCSSWISKRERNQKSNGQHPWIIEKPREFKKNIYFCFDYTKAFDCITSVQSLSHVRFFTSPWTAAPQASLSITNSQSPPKSMSIESVMPSNHQILCCPILLLPSIFPSIRVFSNESALHIMWPKYWSFSFNISPSSEHPGLIYLS